MLRYTALIILSLWISPLSSQNIGDLFDKAKKAVTGKELSSEEIGQGLKQVLSKGVNRAVDSLSAENGYLLSPYKILIPEEALKVTDKLKNIPGFRDVEENLIRKMNEAAELAAAEAGPIFLGAIRQMTFRDAVEILRGEPDAATRYLERTTYDSLYTIFEPIVVASLDEVNAREYWRSAVNTYNKIPFTKRLDPDLEGHVTREALAGLFGLIEKEEAHIRKDPAARTTELLQKVFSREP